MKTRKSYRGGNVKAAGGFGCIFYPHVFCKGDRARFNNKKSANRISKVLTKKHAKDEYNDTVKFKPCI